MTSTTSSRPVRIPPRDFHETAGLEDWRVLGDGAAARYRTGSFDAGARLVRAVAELAGHGDRRPDTDLRGDAVTFRLITRTDDFYGLTPEDAALARDVSATARGLGLEPDPAGLQTVQVTVDALVGADVVPFWRALLGYRDRAGSPEDLVDPHDRNAPFYFQRMDVPRTERNRLHIDVWVPYDQAEARIAAALAAGGRLLSAEHAPGHWVLADAEGNEACVGTAGWTGGPVPALGG